MQAITLNWIASCVAVLALITASCAPAAAPAPTAQPVSTAKPAETPGATLGAPSPTPKAAVEQPRYGGIFTSSITANPPSLDAQQESATNTSLIVSPIYSNLVQLDPLTGDKFLPGLATKWEMSQDGLSWTFDIRDGVKFHDGTPFTVDDAVFSLKRLTDPPKGIRSQLLFLLKPVVGSVDKAGNQLKIKLKDPFPVMLELMAHNFGPIYSQKYVQKQGDMTTTAMGTGPFKLKSYTPGVSLEGVKSPDFWVKGKPYLDGYRFLVIKDVATHLSAFRTGKLNTSGKGFATLTPTEMDTVKKENADLKFFPSATLVGPFASLNWTRRPFQDQRVRKAVFLALDRQAALKVLAQGQGVIGRPFPVAPWGIPNDELMQKPGYRQPKDADIAQAKKLLAEAGHPDGFDLTVLARPMWQAKDPAIFMTSQLAQIGIKAKVNALEDAVVQDLARKGDFDAFFYTPFWSLSDPTWQGRFWAPGGGANYARNDSDKELASLMDQQAKILDPTQRNVVIRKVEEHLLDALPGIPVVWLRSYIGLRPEVKNFSPGNDYLGNTLEEIWLTK